MAINDITSQVYDDGLIEIPQITGHVAITLRTSSTVAEPMFTTRLSGSSNINIVNKGVLKSIKGNTIIWTQWFKDNLNIPFDKENVDNTNGERYPYINNAIPGMNTFSSQTVGQQYYIRNNVEYTSTQIFKNFYISENQNQNISAGVRIETVSTAVAKTGGVRFQNLTQGYHVTGTLRYLNKINLSHLFGLGNEPTKDQFEKLFPPQRYLSEQVVRNNCATSLVIKKPTQNILENNENIVTKTLKYINYETLQILTTNDSREIYFVPVSASTAYHIIWKGPSNGNFRVGCYNLASPDDCQGVCLKNGCGNISMTYGFNYIFTTASDTTYIVLDAALANWLSYMIIYVDGTEQTIQTLNLNLTTLTGKRNGYGESQIIFPNGLKSTWCLPIPEIEDVTYIEKSDSTASYFAVPYVCDGQDINIKLKIRVSSYISTTNNLPWFVATPVADNRFRIIRASNNNTGILIQCGSSTYLNTNHSLGTVYTIDMSWGSVTINDNTYSLPTTVGTTNNTSPIRLLGGVNARLYYFQIYKAGTLVVDLIPKIDTNGVACLYDTIADTYIYLTKNLNNEGLVVTNARTSIQETLLYDEIKKDHGIWKAYKRVGNNRVNHGSTTTGRYEYNALNEEEVYVLDNQFDDELLVDNDTIEEILPKNTSSGIATAPPNIEILYGAIPIS